MSKAGSKMHKKEQCDAVTIIECRTSSPARRPATPRPCAGKTVWRALNDEFVVAYKNWFKSEKKVTKYTKTTPMVPSVDLELKKSLHHPPTRHPSSQGCGLKQKKAHIAKSKST